jgi:hypothetical protein
LLEFGRRDFRRIHRMSTRPDDGMAEAGDLQNHALDINPLRFPAQSRAPRS